jgi:glycerate 2-kinase
MTTDYVQRILNTEELLSHGNVAGRKAMVEILEAGLRAANPYTNSQALMRREGNKLIFGGRDFIIPGDPNQGDEVVDLDEVDRILVVGAGKGIQYAAKAIEDILGDRLTGGHVIDKHGTPLILERIGVTFGAHPVPDEGCVEGCRRILETLHGLTERDLVITVVGNGVSALLTLPSEGVTLEDVRQMTHLMQIVRGAPTGDLNNIRDNLDQLKGGRITRFIQPARSIHIVAWTGTWESVVLKNGFLHTLPNAVRYEQAVTSLKKWDAWDEVAASVREHLTKADPALATVRPEEYLQWRFRVFGTMPNHLGMLPVAQRKARELGYQAHILYNNSHFEAAPGGVMAAAIANQIEQAGEPFQPPVVLLGGGEMLVTVGKENGMGGRNQEFALSAARRIVGSKRIVIGSVDSDGTDGPGHQFNKDHLDVPELGGAIVDGGTLAAAQAAGFNLEAELKRHNTSPLLHAVGGGVVISRNISMNDLSVILVD